MSIERRDFFAILGVCAASATELLAQHEHQNVGATPNFANYQPRALAKFEYEMLDALAETLLPADETGPGAHDAHVVYYIDVVLTHGPKQRLLAWKSGLARVEALVAEFFGRGFVACSDSQRQQVVAELAKNEMTPRTEGDRFFVEFKRMVLDGFYFSDLVRREHLMYKGNTAITEFAGCTHADHQHAEVA